MTNDAAVLPATDAGGSLKPRAFDTIVFGGLAIGILDFVDASTFFPLYYGITIQQVWWGPASGVLGREAGCWRNTKRRVVGGATEIAQRVFPM